VGRIRFCHSCGAPLNLPEFQGAAEDYCSRCTDDAGTLKSRDEVRAGIAALLMTWQKDLDQQQAIHRAAHFVNAMPAWAEDERAEPPPPCEPQPPVAGAYGALSTGMTRSPSAASTSPANPACWSTFANCTWERFVSPAPPCRRP